MWALVTESLATGPTVVFGELDAEFLPAVVAVQDFMVWNPVCRSGSIFYQTYGGSDGAGGERWRKFVKTSMSRTSTFLQSSSKGGRPHTQQAVTLPLRGRQPSDNTSAWQTDRMDEMGNGFLPHSASLQRNRLFFLKLWHLPLLILFQKVSMMRQLLFATSSFSCGQENTVTKPHIQKHWTEEDLFFLSWSCATNSPQRWWWDTLQAKQQNNDLSNEEFSSNNRRFRCKAFADIPELLPSTWKSSNLSLY